MYRSFLRVLLLCTLTISMSVSSATNDSFKNIDDLIAKSNFASASNLIDKALKKSPKNLEYLTRKSRITALLGDNASGEETKVKLYDEAQNIAKQIIEAYPESANGYLRKAVASGKLALFKGILESRSLVLEIRSDAQKVLGLSKTTNYDKALAHYLLGRAHLKLAEKPRVLRLPLGLGWASKSKGAEHLKSAADINPDSITFNLDYGKWLKQNGDKEAAKAYLNKVSKLSVYDPADAKHKETAKKLLAELK